MKKGLIIYTRSPKESFQRGKAYRETLPDKELWLLGNSDEIPDLLQKFTFHELVFLPEAKEQRKDILRYVKTPAKVRLLSENQLQVKGIPTLNQVKEQTEKSSLKRQKKQPKSKKNSYLLMAFIGMILLGLILWNLL